MRRVDDESRPREDLFRLVHAPDWRSLLWSPFNSPTAFKGLPRAFVQVAGKDLIRDDGILYARALADHGVETRLAVYPGVPHAFWYAFPQLKQSRELMTDIAVGAAWLLRRSVDLGEAEEALQYAGVATSSSS